MNRKEIKKAKVAYTLEILSDMLFGGNVSISNIVLDPNRDMVTFYISSTDSIAEPSETAWSFEGLEFPFRPEGQEMLEIRPEYGKTERGTIFQ